MENLDVRFLKLSFKLKFTQSGELPQYKVSTIRGGIGEMLLNENCIYDRNCKECSFAGECVVQKIFYHPLKIVPEYVQEKSNMGYLYECKDFRTKVQKGDNLRFSMLLMGDVIIHAPQILRALKQFGEKGFGVNEVKFVVERVENHRREVVCDENGVYNHNFNPDKVLDYVENRMAENSKKKLQICFITPWTQKYKGKFITEFNADAFSDSVYRRVYLANCMEGNSMKANNPFEENLNITFQKVKHREFTRFSSTHNQKINLKGIIGKFSLDNVPKEFLPYIYAGELLHIGKNTSMGFGQYKIL